MKLILHAVLEADDGPELDINTGGVLDTRLVVNPIKDAFGIPVILHNMQVYACMYIQNVYKDSNINSNY